MQSILTSACGPWLEPVSVMTVGVVVIVGLAAVIARAVRPAVWQRTVWQGAVLGLLVLLLVEMSGGASALVELARAQMRLWPTKPEPPRVASPRHTPDTGWAREPMREPEPSSGGSPEISLSESWERGGRHEPSVAQAARAEGEWPALWLLGSGELARLEEGDSWGESVPHLPRAVPGLLRHGQRIVTPAALVSVEVSTETSSGRVGKVPARASADRPSDGDRASMVAAGGPESRYPLWPARIWLFGGVLLGARFLWARWLLLGFRLRNTSLRDPALAERVGVLARRLGMRRPVSVLEAAGLTAPVAFGCFRPTLALPAAFFGQFDRRQQEAVIVHELAHLAARDPAWQAIADLVCAVLWWHPLAWWSRRRLRSASEVAADEASRLLPGGADVLASCLIALGRRLAGAPPRLGWLSMGGPGFRSGLGRRVEHLLSLPGGSWRAPRRGRLGLAKATLPVALAIAAVLSTAWAHPRAVSQEGGTPMNVFQSSWRRSLAAAALVALLSPFSGDAVAQEERAEEVPALFDEERPAEEGRRERESPEAREGERESPEARERDRESPEAREREPGERERGEREMLMHQVEVLGLALPALREAERGDAIELVERAIHARKVTLEGRRDDEAHMIRERAPAPGQLAEILAMAAGLWREFGNQDKAQAVAELAEALRAPRDREPERPRRDREREEGERRPEAERVARERAEVGRRLDELRAAHERAQEAGRPDEAERIQREIEEIKRQFERHPDRPMPHPEERDEMERRMNHIRVAVENLHAAGLHEQAEQLARDMERLLHGAPGPPGPDRPPFRRPVPPSRVEGPPPERLEGVLRELHEAVRHLNERMEEMNRNIEREIEAIRRDMEAMGRQRGEERDR